MTTPDNEGHWVTVAEAAQALGKSQRTVRRWVEAGKIPVDRTTPVMRVDIAGHVPDNAGHMPDSAGHAPDPDAPEVVALKGRIAELEATNDLLQELLAEVRQERDYLRSANAAALSKIPNQGPSIWRRLLPWIKDEED